MASPFSTTHNVTFVTPSNNGVTRGFAPTTPALSSFGSPIGASVSSTAPIATPSASPWFGQQSSICSGLSGGLSNSYEGTRVTPYTPTNDIDCSNKSHDRLTSISAMVQYSNKSHEELRAEDYKHNRNEGPHSNPLFPGVSKPLPSPFQHSTSTNSGFDGLPQHRAPNHCPEPVINNPSLSQSSNFQQSIFESPVNPFDRSSELFHKSTDPTAAAQTSAAPSPATDTARANQTSNVNLNSQSPAIGVSSGVTFAPSCLIPAFGAFTLNGGSSGLQLVNTESGTACLGFPVIIPATVAFVFQHPQISGTAGSLPLFGVQTTNTAVTAPTTPGNISVPVTAAPSSTGVLGGGSNPSPSACPTPNSGSGFTFSRRSRRASGSPLFPSCAAQNPFFGGSPNIPSTNIAGSTTGASTTSDSFSPASQRSSFGIPANLSSNSTPFSSFSSASQSLRFGGGFANIVAGASTSTPPSGGCVPASQCPPFRSCSTNVPSTTTVGHPLPDFPCFSNTVSSTTGAALTSTPPSGGCVPASQRSSFGSCSTNVPSTTNVGHPASHFTGFSNPVSSTTGALTSTPPAGGCVPPSWAFGNQQPSSQPAVESENRVAADPGGVPKGFEPIVEKLGVNPWGEEGKVKGCYEGRQILSCEDASNDSDILALAEFAVEQHNAMDKDDGKVVFSKVAAACLEAVDGGRYHIVLEGKVDAPLFYPRHRRFYAVVLRKKTDRPNHLTVLESWLPGKMW